MPDPSEEPRLEVEEDGGGPVKSFLEHLEDLRWVLIKCGATTLIGMVVCLLAANQVVSILKWPLERARKLHRYTGQRVEVVFGTNRLASFTTATNRLGNLNLGSNPQVTIQFEPVLLTSNLGALASDQMLLGVRVITNNTAADPPGKGPDLIFLDPAAPFISSLHLAFFGGLLLAAPFLFYYIGQFVVPALKFKEKKYVLRGFGIGVGLFLTGVCFCYFGILPFALRAAEAYSNWMGIEMPDWRAETYFSFVTKFMLGMGLGFELPVVLLALVKIGILDYAKLAAFRRYMIVINLILGALLTTPEVLTQILMAVPLQVLYEASVWIAWYWERQEKKKAKEAEAKV